MCMEEVEIDLTILPVVPDGLFWHTFPAYSFTTLTTNCQAKQRLPPAKVAALFPTSTCGMPPPPPPPPPPPSRVDFRLFLTRVVRARVCMWSDIKTQYPPGGHRNHPLYINTAQLLDWRCGLLSDPAPLDAGSTSNHVSNPA